MPGWLSTGDDRQSRGKSPSGRERERSRSNVRDDRDRDRDRDREREKEREREREKERDRDYDRRSNGQRKSSSKKYSESESETSSSEDDRRRRRSTSSKKSYDPPSDDDRRKRSSKRHDDSGSDRDRHSSSRKDDKYSRHRDPSPAKDDRRRSTRHKDRSPSDDDRRKSSSKKSSRKASESSSDEDISIVIQRKSKGKADDDKSKAAKSVAPAAAAAPAPAPVPPPVTMYAAPPPGYVYAQPAYPPQPAGAYHAEVPTRHGSYVGHDPRYAPPPPMAPTAPPAAMPGGFVAPPVEAAYRPRAASNAAPHYADVRDYKYTDPNSAYRYGDRPQPTKRESDQRSRQQYVEISPDQLDSKSQRQRESDRAEKKYLEDKYRRERDALEEKHVRRESRDELKTEVRRPSRLSMSSAAGLGAGLGASLGIGAPSAGHGGGKPPASPLLEAYKGTYQSISPMPNALVLAAHPDDSDLSDFGLDSDSDFSDSDPNANLKRKIRALEREKERGRVVDPRGLVRTGSGRGGRPNVETREPDDDYSGMVIAPLSGQRGAMVGKKVKFYDPVEDAKEIAAALKGTHKAPNVKPLIKILPGLSIDDLDALKAEYKKHAKIDGQGINMSKHIKMRVTGYVGKAAYACSLGQWESEGFWANCYYQAGASRRELLIESLMGRTNQQIREIKNFFKDKKYDDDLEKCMRTELKADKFRVAILLALQEERMPESAPIDPRLVREDVTSLHNALTGAGGESAMIATIVRRSDAHLREVMREYERLYHANFAREMINKSRNLVGETLAHILNGALNRPMRDALLLHQAIAETAPGKERAELLISRLIRLHWEPKHLEKVKEQYAKRYQVPLELAIKKEIQSGMKTEEGIAWTTFCIALVKSSQA